MVDYVVSIVRSPNDPRVVGGQHTNGPDLYAVQVKHVETGITVIVPCERPHKNRKHAMEAIEYILTCPDFENFYGDILSGE